MKARGRLPADFTADLTDQFNMKLLPTSLVAKFDFQDDEEDQSRAIIKDIRARRRERLFKSGLLEPISEMRMMVEDGDMSRSDFIRWMMDNGNLEDGTTIGVLFHSEDPLISSLVRLEGIEDPLVFEDNDKETVMREIHVQQSLCLKSLAQSGSSSKAQKAKQALAALDWLAGKYDAVPEEVPPELAAYQEEEEAEEVEDVFPGENTEANDEEE
jgi:hypothetical protein